MARATWDEIRESAQRQNFEFFKESILIRVGARAVSLSAVLDTSQDAETRAKSPPGTFPVQARVSVWRSELGWLPSATELWRVSRMARPEEEQAYNVVAVEVSGDLLIVDLQAHTNNGSPFFQ